MAFAAPLAAVLTAGGTLFSGFAQAGAADYQAQVARNNATIAQQNAVYAERAGQARAQEASLKGASRMGAIKAAQAANGIDVNTGSAVDVQASERATGELTTENVMQNAMLQAYGYRSQAMNFKAEAGLDEATAEEAPIGAALGATGTLLGNAKGVNSSWFDPSKWGGGTNVGGGSGPFDLTAGG